MFDKSDRSRFKYWFAHWCSYNMVALNLNAWKFKYLFHDIEKPFMLYWYMWVCRLNHTDAYKKVQKWHRAHNRHHLEYKGKKDYESMVIDWECSRFTKTSSPRTALEEALIKNKQGKLSKEDSNGLYKALIKLKLDKKAGN